MKKFIINKKIEYSKSPSCSSKTLNFIDVIFPFSFKNIVLYVSYFGLVWNFILRLNKYVMKIPDSIGISVSVSAGMLTVKLIIIIVKTINSIGK